MSDSTGNSPPPEGGAFQEREGSDFSESPPPETSDGGSPPRLNPLDITIWVSRFRERTFAWLDNILSRKTDGEDPFYLKTVLPVMDRLAGLIAMILVDRHYGPAGLGIFAWFFSLLAIAGYLGRYGIPIYVENHIARYPESINEISANALAALVALGIAAMILCGATVLSNDGVGWGAGDSILYLLLGPTILIQNINALRLAMLNGTGRHNPAAGLRIRQRVVFLVATLALYLENKRL